MRKTWSMASSRMAEKVGSSAESNSTLGGFLRSGDQGLDPIGSQAGETGGHRFAVGQLSLFRHRPFGDGQPFVLPGGSPEGAATGRARRRPVRPCSGCRAARTRFRSRVSRSNAARVWRGMKRERHWATSCRGLSYEPPWGPDKAVVHQVSSCRRRSEACCVDSGASSRSSTSSESSEKHRRAVVGALEVAPIAQQYRLEAVDQQVDVAVSVEVLGQGLGERQFTPW